MKKNSLTSREEFTSKGIKQFDINFPDCNFKATFYIPRKKNCYLNVRQNALLSYKGPKKFNYALIDFYDTFSNLINSRLISSKVKKDNENIKVLSFKNKKLEQPLKKMEVLVRKLEDNSADKEKLKYEFKKNIAIIASCIDEERGGLKADTVIVPLKGGTYLLPYLQINPRKIHAVDCKRIPIKHRKGNFALGMSSLFYGFPFIQGYTKSSIDKKRIRIIEVSLVSGMTTIGILLDFYRLKAMPLSIEINSIAMTQQAQELISKTAERLGYKKNVIKYYSGGLFYNIGNYYSDKDDVILSKRGNKIFCDELFS